MKITNATVQYFLKDSFSVLDDGISHTTFNVTIVSPKTPTLYSAMNMGNLAKNFEVYDKYSNPIMLSHDEWT
ncbi:hypothetical protein BGZ49_009311 [Haplosporangium sp. Z 27]|nr:hypothetical protein BGZ49_009311 [Haplosporangium sp. Z 27]